MLVASGNADRARSNCGFNLSRWCPSRIELHNGRLRVFFAMTSLRKACVVALAVISSLLSPRASTAASDKSGTPLAAAVCPIVYPIDRSPSERGYHYIFYGNAFFINNEGYLITAAHVLSRLHGVQAYVLLTLPMAPPRLVKAKVVTRDQDHDVALLQATPNPFDGKYLVNFLRLATRRLEQPREVLADALRPSHLKDPYTFDALSEDRPAGEIIEYRFVQLDRGQPDTEIFLFNHDVLLGDSGAPVVSADSQDVVGLVEGRWQQGSSVAKANSLQKQGTGWGAVVPIHYVIALLLQNGIAWQGVPDNSARVDPDAASGKPFSPPVPLSLVGTPYPSEVFSGGEVVLDALVEANGSLGDIRVFSGENPFLQKALAAARTWTFLPARSGEKAVETRIGIIFQFPSSLNSVRAPREYHYEGGLSDATERGALPVDTPGLESSHTKQAEGRVILSEQINSHGQVEAAEIVRGQESLTGPIVDAARQWRFAPGRRGGDDSDSEVIVVVTFRPSPGPAHVPTSKSMH